MRLFDAFLNGYVVFLVLLFATGGVVPAGLIGASSKFEPSKMDHWVAGLVVLLVVRWLLPRARPIGDVAFVRALRAVGARLVSAPWSVYVIIAGWGLSLDYIITVAISAFFVPHYLAVFVPALGHGPWDVFGGVG